MFAEGGCPPSFTFSVPHPPPAAAAHEYSRTPGGGGGVSASEPSTTSAALEEPTRPALLGPRPPPADPRPHLEIFSPFPAHVPSQTQKAATTSPESFPLLPVCLPGLRFCLPPPSPESPPGPPCLLPPAPLDAPPCLWCRAHLGHPLEMELQPPSPQAPPLGSSVLPFSLGSLTAWDPASRWIVVGLCHCHPSMVSAGPPSLCVCRGASPVASAPSVLGTRAKRSRSR